MLIPKEFEGLEDLESMLLTSLLGTLVSLKDDLISYKQAENYWISEFTLELFEALKLSDGVVNLLKECLLLNDLREFSSLYKDKLDELIEQCKGLISTNYTEYSSTKSFIPTILN